MSARIRCAIYTRKSSDDGLEQEFNSLDAQREACAAFIASQRGLGWIALPAHYDDGGLSGGTLERPALQALLADIGAGRVDLIVVYKVDRLTRSLADFAKIVEVFDAAGVSFVSVTQQFNTSTSMGRLTLNMLLSFAQFEREVTGERIRDKIAASKRKGMWMGGVPPLGYDVCDKKLVVNLTEAATVRSLFRLYLELGTVAKLLAESKRLGLVTRRRSHADGRQTGGLAFTRGHLYQLLSNPLYIGEVAHRGASYPGQHEAIVDRQTFEAVRQRLASNATERRSATNASAPSLLTGLIYDDTGERLCPTHASKKGRRYRYYISKRLMHRGAADETGWRLPAKELENAVVGAICDFLRDEIRIVDALHLGNATPGRLGAMLAGGIAIAAELEQGQAERRRTILHRLIQRVELSPEVLRFELKRSDLMQLIEADNARHETIPDGQIAFSIPVLLRRRGVEAKLVLGMPAGQQPAPDRMLVALLRRAHLWLDQMTAGEAESVGAIAERADLHASDVGRCLPLAFLAPDIVAAILDGRQPVELTAKRLTQIGALPLSWEMQRRLLGFAA